MFQRFCFSVVMLLLCVVSVFAVVDSAAVANGIAIGTAVGQQIAQSTGHSELVAIIGGIGLAIANIFSFIWGHSHGKKSLTK